MSNTIFTGVCFRECKNRGGGCNDCFGFSNHDGKSIEAVNSIAKRSVGVTGKGVVDIKGNPQRLNSYQKNSFYRQAKQLKTEIEGVLCTKDECHKPSDRNVHKMRNGEWAIKKKITAYTKCMKVIGAGPKEYNVEKLRR